MILLGLLNALVGAMNIVLYTYSGAWHSLLVGVFCTSCGTAIMMMNG